MSRVFLHTTQGWVVRVQGSDDAQNSRSTRDPVSKILIVDSLALEFVEQRPEIGAEINHDATFARSGPRQGRPLEIAPQSCGAGTAAGSSAGWQGVMRFR